MSLYLLISELSIPLDGCIRNLLEAVNRYDPGESRRNCGLKATKTKIIRYRLKNEAQYLAEWYYPGEFRRNKEKMWPKFRD